MELAAGHVAGGDLRVLVGVFAQEGGSQLLQAEAAVEVRVIDLIAHDGEEVFYGVDPVDPLSYLTSAILLMAVAGAACWLPTRRAARVNPVEALKAE